MLQDYAADQVVAKFQAASCEQLKAQKLFIDKIAAPVLNKMFECGMIP